MDPESPRPEGPHPQIAGARPDPSPEVMTDQPGSPTRVDLLARVTALEGKLASLPEIEQAKGALMATYGISADAAFALLRFHSQHRNVKIRAIAAQLTTLMQKAPTTTAAITRFDQLLDAAANVAAPTSPPRAGDDSAQTMLQAVAAAPPGITIAANTPDLPLEYANDMFSQLTGYPAGDVVGRNCRFLQGSDTDPHQVAALSRALHTGREVSVVLRNYRKDGSPFWNQVSISPIHGRNYTITHYLGTQINVTARINPHQQSTR